MNKILIPTILVATVMIAGVFAFMPIEKATTVHAGIGTTANVIEDTATLLAAGTDVVCTVTSASDMIIVEVILDNSPTVGGDKSFDVDNVTIGGSQMAGPLALSELTLASGDVEAYVGLFATLTNSNLGPIQQIGPIPVNGGEDFVITLDADDGGNDKIIDVIVGIQGNAAASINCV